jgi:hypothetical protein
MEPAASREIFRKRRRERFASRVDSVWLITMAPM